MKCTDDDCGHEFPKSEAEIDLNVDLTEPGNPLETWDDDGDVHVTFGIDVQFTVSCPECHEQIGDDYSGETEFTVECGAG